MSPPITPVVRKSRTLSGIEERLGTDLLDDADDEGAHEIHDQRPVRELGAEPPGRQDGREIAQGRANGPAQRNQKQSLHRIGPSRVGANMTGRAVARRVRMRKSLPSIAEEERKATIRRRSPRGPGPT